jgi:hypothetical protein
LIDETSLPRGLPSSTRTVFRENTTSGIPDLEESVEDSITPDRRGTATARGTQ